MQELPLVGVSEIAKIAGVNLPAVSNWITRYSHFPSPVAILKCGPIFWQPEVTKWLENTNRL